MSIIDNHVFFPLSSFRVPPPPPAPQIQRTSTRSDGEIGGDVRMTTEGGAGNDRRKNWIPWIPLPTLKSQGNPTMHTDNPYIGQLYVHIV